MADVTAELKWLCSLLGSLGVSYQGPCSLFGDSKSSLYIAQNPIFHEHTKHIEVDCHYIHDAIQAGLMTTAHVTTAEQLADCFTKAFDTHQFQYLLGKLGIYDMLQLEGGGLDCI